MLQRKISPLSASPGIPKALALLDPAITGADTGTLWEDFLQPPASQRRPRPAKRRPSSKTPKIPQAVEEWRRDSCEHLNTLLRSLIRHSFAARVSSSSSFHHVPAQLKRFNGKIGVGAGCQAALPGLLGEFQREKLRILYLTKGQTGQRSSDENRENTDDWPSWPPFSSSEPFDSAALKVAQRRRANQGNSRKFPTEFNQSGKKRKSYSAEPAISLGLADRLFSSSACGPEEFADFEEEIKKITRKTKKKNNREKQRVRRKPGVLSAPQPSNEAESQTATDSGSDTVSEIDEPEESEEILSCA